MDLVTCSSVLAGGAAGGDNSSMVMLTQAKTQTYRMELPTRNAAARCGAKGLESAPVPELSTHPTRRPHKIVVHAFVFGGAGRFRDPVYHVRR